MPGIASDRSPGIQISPIASIGADIPPTPAIGDLMDAFKQGFITVDDLQRRNVQNISTNDQLKTQLQASDFQRKLAPGAFANAQAAQGLQASQIQAATQLQPGATQLAFGTQEAALQEQGRQANRLSDDTSRQLAQKADDTKRIFVETFGHDPAKSIKILAPLPELPFEQWVEKEHGAELKKEINEFKPGVPDKRGREEILKTMVDAFMPGVNTLEANTARSQYEQQTREELDAVPYPDQLKADFEREATTRFLNNPALRTEYENYKVAQAKHEEPVKFGSEQHTIIMQQRIQQAQDAAALRAAKLTAVPKILEGQAAAIVAAPAKAAEAQNKAQGDVLAEKNSSKPLIRFEAQFEAFEKVDALRNSGRTPTNADDIATMYLLVKLLDPTSAVREGEAKLAQSTNPYIKQLYNQGKALFVSKDKIFGEQARNEMYATMDTLKQGALTTIAPEIKRISSIAIDRGVPLDQVFTGPYRAILSGGARPATATPAAAAPAAAAKPSPTGTRRVVPNSGPYAGKTLEWSGSGWSIVQ